jgi:hypothetical protein
MTILDVADKAFFDNSIINSEKHSHLPYISTSFNNNDEIRIPIQQTDIYTLPSESYVYIEGKVTCAKSLATCKFVNNAFAHLFDEIRYEIGGKVIDRTRNPGITTTLKGYASYNSDDVKHLSISGWSNIANNSYAENLLDTTNGKFNMCVPLNSLLGFAEDFKKIIINIHQELVLIRSSNDINAFMSDTAEEAVNIHIDKIIWKVPHIVVSDVERLKLLQYVNTNSELEIGFRTWELYEYPQLPQATQQTWTVKSANQLEKPRFIILAFQTAKKGFLKQNCATFDNCSLSDIKLHLNSEIYPYDNMNIKFSEQKYAVLYDMYAKFQKEYYDKANEPLLTLAEFKKSAPIIVINCSHQNDLLTSGTVDVRLEFSHENAVAANTTCYCLIIHDRIVKYSPLTGLVRTI